MADLAATIHVGWDEVETTPKGHPDRAGLLNTLGHRLRSRLWKTRVFVNFKEAIQTEQGWYSNTLGVRLGERYIRTGALGDSEEGIQRRRGVIETMLKDHPGRARNLSSLGVTFSDRYLRTGVLADLEEAIRFGREAVETTPKDHPGRARYLYNFAVILGDRYLRKGALADLEEAVRFGREAVEMTSKDHPDRPTYLNNLGIRLGNRYSRIGALADLEEAIQFGREAVKMTPKGHPGQARHLNNLGTRLSDRYLRIGALADLEEAIQLGWEATEATLKDHPDQATYLNSLGTRLVNRYLRTGALADLEEAIRVGRKAVRMTPEDHPGRAWHFNNLGMRLGDRYLRTGVLADLEEAIRFGREAAETTPKDHPDQAMVLNSLGVRLRDRYSREGALADLQEAISCHQSALRHLPSPTLTRIVAGRQLLQFSLETRKWQQAYEASEIAVLLISKLTSRSLGHSDKQYILGEVAGLASDAAAAALYVGKGPLVALDFLEQGRGVLAASLEEMRVDILDLKETHPDLAEQFIRLRDELEVPVARSSPNFDEKREPSWKDQASRRYEISNKLDMLIDEIRKQPGFEDFLLPPNETEIRAAAGHGPIVVINVSSHRCDAILIEQQQIQSLVLPNLSSDEIRRKAEENNLGSPKVLAWLWEAIANPILHALGFTQPPLDDNWPHIWWIPTYILSKFPLHAAGRHYKGSSETVLDRVVSSYSSSVKAIIHCRQRPVSLPTPARALLVAMEHTPGNSRLPFATKEVAMLRGLCKSMQCEPIEPGRRKKDIISHLPQCKIFHFAGHGCTDGIDPSMSHLLLEGGKDDPLMVANLLEINIRQHSPFLAYLSACGTGRIIDKKFFDESIHLISACQLAGFRHVIGTLWEVKDELCVDMARITYEGIKNGGMKNESVSRGLHNAMRNLRDRWNNIPAKTKGESSSASNVDLSFMEDGLKARNASHEDQRVDRLPRDIVLCDEDDENEVRPLHWVPYVHFGV